MPNVSVTNRVFKDIYYLFPYSPALDEKSPRRSEPEGNMLEHFIFMFLPQLFSAFFKTFTSFVKYFHGWGPPRVEAREVVFRNSSYTVGFLLFLDPTDVQYLYFVKSVFLGIVSRLNSHQMVKSAHALPSMNRSDRGSIFGQNQKYRPISGPPPPPPTPSYPQTPESKSGVGGKRGSKGSLTSNWILNIDFWRKY